MVFCGCWKFALTALYISGSFSMVAMAMNVSSSSWLLASFFQRLRNADFLLLFVSAWIAQSLFSSGDFFDAEERMYLVSCCGYCSSALRARKRSNFLS